MKEAKINDIKSLAHTTLYSRRNREFWRRGYYVDTVGKNTKKDVYFMI